MLHMVARTVASLMQTAWLPICSVGVDPYAAWTFSPPRAAPHIIARPPSRPGHVTDGVTNSQAPRRRTPRATLEGHRSGFGPRPRPASVPGRARPQGRGPRLAASSLAPSHPATVGPVAAARRTDRTPARRSPPAGRDPRPIARGRSSSLPASHLLRVLRGIPRTQPHRMDHDVPAVNPFNRDDLKRNSAGVGAKEENQIVASRTWIQRTNAMLHGELSRSRRPRPRSAHPSRRCRRRRAMRPPYIIARPPSTPRTWPVM
jgi:hypothetical protein